MARLLSGYAGAEHTCVAAGHSVRLRSFFARGTRIGEYLGQKGAVTMLYGGNATVYVSNMDQAVRFYTEVLGLKLTNRFGNHWATVQVGKTLVLGLHPWREPAPAPGTKGSVQI